MMYRIAFLFLFLCSCFTEAAAKVSSQDPFHIQKVREFLVELPPEYESSLFMNKQQDLEGCLWSYVNKQKRNGPKSIAGLNRFVMRAVKSCERDVMAVIRTHDEFFGKGSGAMHIFTYLLSVRSYVQDFFKVPVVETK